ncbi:tetratricopeptide repeat protein [Pirellulimonas nuda]|uniref:tetratricopeptide repeat protein n=1 Tax=Pirellulimonas nuda TaxID=2528009 RepID=UPI0018D340AB|nr:tetratricopeptide repeat protein [Pirellulimonas nuda]
MKLTVWFTAGAVLAGSGISAAPPTFMGDQSRTTAPAESGWRQTLGLGGPKQVAPPKLSHDYSQPWAPQPPSTWERVRGAVTDNPITRTLSQPSRPQHPSLDDAWSVENPENLKSPDFLMGLARQAESQGNVELARTQLQQAIAAAPNSPAPIRELARLEDRQNRLDVAEECYRRALAAAPDQPGVLNDLGLCLARSGKLEEAVQVFERAIALDPAKTLYRNNIATVLVELSRDDEALSHLLAAHQSAAAHHNLACLLARRGRVDDAAQHWQLALQCDGRCEPARQGLAGLQRQGDAALAQAPPAAEPPSTPLDFGGTNQQADTVSVASEPGFPRLLPPATPR